MKVGMAMRISYSLKSLFSRSHRTFILVFSVFIFCQSLWAAQEVVVTSESAVIYADEEMTSPVGYVVKGKRVRVGSHSRNQDRVYPIIVSGKVAYIRVKDVTSAAPGQEGHHLVSGRFQNEARGPKIETSVLLSALNYNSQVVLEETNGGIDDKDPLNWSGFSLKAIGRVERWELELLTNYLSATEEQEEFKMLEAGVGGAFRMLDWKRLTLRLEGQMLWVPWASYALGEQFRKNGSGYTFGGGLGLSLRLTQHWGIDAYGGAYYTRLYNFDVPPPYVSIEPVFYGTRLGAGIHYAF